MALAGASLLSLRFRSLRPPKEAGFSIVLAVGSVMASSFFAESGRLHHLMLSYPFVQLTIAITALWLWNQLRRWQKSAAMGLCLAGIGAIAATALSSTSNICWYVKQVRATGGIGHSASEIIDLANFIAHSGEYNYITGSWGLYNPVFTLTGGHTQMREFYFPMLAREIPAPVREEVGQFIVTHQTRFVYSHVMPGYSEVREKWFAIAAGMGYSPRLVKQFRHRATGDLLYSAYEFEPAVRPQF
jgi:hypothetical protein